MKKYRFVVLSNPTPGMEDEYNKWYNETHMREVVAVSGIDTAQRFKIHEESLRPGVNPAHKYLAIYEIETNDISSVMEDLRSRPGTPAMFISEAFDTSTVSSLVYEVITDVVKSGD